MTVWEDIEVPKGAYISWGTKPGQHVTGKVIDYSIDGGTNFAGDPCPSLTIELTEPAASINKEGVRTDFGAGELVQLNAGQVSLKRAVRAADPSPGDLVKVTLDNLVKTTNGTVKEFGIKIARGAGASTSATASSAAEDDSPPF
ncbi:MAG: hypothetical protein K0U84_01780 [Actinomycetia bacterium]|nr:hypothetical protein [Actinomycetes bacterium]